MSKVVYPAKIEALKNKQEQSLRDHFAGLAMQGMISRLRYSFELSHAEKAYKIADAMLEVRNEQPAASVKR